MQPLGGDCHHETDAEARQATQIASGRIQSFSAAASKHALIGWGFATCTELCYWAISDGTRPLSTCTQVPLENFRVGCCLGRFADDLKQAHEACILQLPAFPPHGLLQEDEGIGKERPVSKTIFHGILPPYFWQSQPWSQPRFSRTKEIDNDQSNLVSLQELKVRSCVVFMLTTLFKLGRLSVHASPRTCQLNLNITTLFVRVCSQFRRRML